MRTGPNELGTMVSDLIIIGVNGDVDGLGS